MEDIATYFNLCLKNYKFNDEMASGRMFFINKKKNLNELPDMSEARPITVMNSLFKLFEIITLRRMPKFDEIIKGKAQTGFKDEIGAELNIYRLLK